MVVRSNGESAVQRGIATRSPATCLRQLLEPSFPASDQVVVVNFDLDIPPSMECMPSMTPVHTMDKEVLAEAQFLAQQRKYWPSGFI